MLTNVTTTAKTDDSSAIATHRIDITATKIEKYGGK